MTVPAMLLQQHCTALLGREPSDVTLRRMICALRCGQSSAESDSADGLNKVSDETGRGSYGDNP